ncbi:MAG: tetraacyldisaccharide 4'-kinase [Flavobacteriales bacterium]|nr:tetraacyldisaccharide 4'-kinase [Flavobacteriales bacterium]
MKVPAKYVMLLRRVLFFPYTMWHGLVLTIRHALYDRGYLKTTRPSVPTIAVGNLSLGGTGKTPMLELVLRILGNTRPIAALSRGYGRKSTDIHEVEATDTAEISGDEPVQVKKKFPDVSIFVGADRVKAIEQIHATIPEIKAVVLDDALQHRKLNAGMNILLTTWARPFCDDALVPAGTLRDLRSRACVAELVVVTKCPVVPKADEQGNWRTRLGLRGSQALFFAGIEYDEPKWYPDREGPVPTGQDVCALLFTGIADPAPLVMHARSMFGAVEHMAFPDHHTFSTLDLGGLAARYANFAPGPKILITTEKDAARLRTVLAGSPIADLPLAVIGMRAVILNEPERFADIIRHHVEPHPTHR